MFVLYVFAGLFAIGLLLMWWGAGRPKEFNYPELRKEFSKLPAGTIITPVSVLTPPPPQTTFDKFIAEWGEQNERNSF